MTSVLAVHLTDVPFYHALVKPDNVTRDEQKYLDSVAKYQQKAGAYAFVQGGNRRSCASAERFTGGARRLDRREVPGMERL